MPPRGHYLAHEVGRLAGVSGQCIGQWARNGYIRSSQSKGPPRVYSYQDVGEALYVHALREAHVAYKAIKVAIDHLRREHEYDWPLTHAELSVPTDHPMHLIKNGKQKRSVIEGMPSAGIDTGTGEPVLPYIDLLQIAIDLRRGGWAARDLNIEHIEVDPDRLSGRPVIAGLRVPAEDVALLAEQAGGRDTLYEDYALTVHQVDDAVLWWRTVRSYDNDGEQAA